MSPNRLKYEKSPYLLQHADNPVDWYPWGEEAFERAGELDRPIFLSIGYSTCHWCHVMEHESFEDREVAGLMNETFVSVKVDREERPDIDQVYMSVSRILTGRGGWPLTIIMTPDKKPFYTATYIPKDSRFGTVGMMDLISRIALLWKNKREELVNTADNVTDELVQSSPKQNREDLTRDILKRAYEELKESFDRERGGFGSAPKFPSPHNLDFLLRYWKRTGDPEALSIVEKTLDEIQKGGIYDHLGGGFHRYSTDREWRVPHFEKMLYDQALLTIAYTDAYQATGKDEYGRIVRETLEHLLRDMKDPDGGFYSAEDADSEGEEGKFYLWTEDEVRKLLGDREAEAFVAVYNIEAGGNYQEESTNSPTGRNILYRERPLNEEARDLGANGEELRAVIATAKQKLFRYRESRVRPQRDDKVLTDWNGLTIAALAKAGRALDEPLYKRVAAEAAEFFLNSMRAEDRRLLHRYREGEAKGIAYVDDYAFMVWGLLELYESTFEPEYLKEAVTLNEELIEYFWDTDSGGFFFYAYDSEELLVRTKEFYDGAIPSGNSIAMMNLLRLGRITGDAKLEEKAAEIVRSASSSVRKVPNAFTSLLSSLDFGLGPTLEVVISGAKEAADTKEMLRAVSGTYAPHDIVLFRDPDGNSSVIDDIAPWVKEMGKVDDRATAYVCEGRTCLLPTTDVGRLLLAMESRKGR
ncbi:MAG TPA: thioredoxin domain-containing protein [Spirochaetota bacterium]|nr:thioredoxin domain-containing protein [Spirochaetota bacterium]